MTSQFPHSPERPATDAESLRDFDRLREAFQHRFEALSPHLQRIAQYALADPNRFALQTVAETARQAGVQPSTLVRFARAFGFSGFSEMQRVFRSRLIEGATTFRDEIRGHRNRLEEAAEHDPSAILREFADSSALALDSLKTEIDAVSLQKAIRMMDEARSLYVIGQRRAFPVASYLAYCLTRLEYSCHLLDSVGGMLPQQVATIDTRDLLLAVSFAEYSRPVVEAVSDAHIRNVPVLAITDSYTGPLARNSSLCFVVRDTEVHRFGPLAGPIVLAQSLIISLGYYRDARLGRAADREASKEEVQWPSRRALSTRVTACQTSRQGPSLSCANGTSSAVLKHGFALRAATVGQRCTSGTRRQRPIKNAPETQIAMEPESRPQPILQASATIELEARWNCRTSAYVPVLQ